MTWLDAVAFLAVGVFAVRGFVRGAIEQLALLIGLVLGIWLTVVVSQWVGTHWMGARPAVVFQALRWLAALLAGVAALALCVALGGRARERVHAGAGGHADRAVGVLVGTASGLAAVTFVMIALLSVPQARPVARPVLAARVTAPLLHEAARASGWLERRLPAVGPLGRRFESAESRARRFRRSS